MGMVYKTDAPLHVQVKAYVRVHGPPEEKDKGYVSLSYNDYVTDSYYSHTFAHSFQVHCYVLLYSWTFLHQLSLQSQHLGTILK